jgi:hypothetical protein
VLACAPRREKGGKGWGGQLRLPDIDIGRPPLPLFPGLSQVAVAPFSPYLFNK